MYVVGWRNTKAVGYPLPTTCTVRDTTNQVRRSPETPRTRESRKSAVVIIYSTVGMFIDKILQQNRDNQITFQRININLFDFSDI